MVVLGIVVVLVLGEAVVVGFLLITNSVKEDQGVNFNFNPTLFTYKQWPRLSSGRLLTETGYN